MSSHTPRALAIGSGEEASQAATGMLARHNAVDAVVAGVFAAAGAHAGVLLGPVQLLIAGGGAGIRAVDGRGRQPGSGAARPRGFRPEDEIAPAARVAVPSLPAALATTLATFGSAPLSRVLGPAVDIAKRLSPPRAALLEAMGRRGPTFGAAGFADDLVHAVGRLAGGLLTREDLDEARPALLAVDLTTIGSRQTLTVPWDTGALRNPAARAADSLHTHVLAAMDSRGLVAIACYEVPDDGLAVDSLGLLAPFGAAPVLRGEPRVTPGEPRGAAAPVALVEADGVVCLAIGIATTPQAERILGNWLETVDPFEAAAPEQGRVIGMIRTAAGITSLRRTLAG